MRRATPGNPPRTRIEKENQVTRGTVPVGLWRNCYDADWLAGQRAYMVEDLDIIDADFDLTPPPFNLPGMDML